jgi:uncharacterized ubiquitin-like protein YukD
MNYLEILDKDTYRTIINYLSWQDLQNVADISAETRGKVSYAIQASNFKNRLAKLNTEDIHKLVVLLPAKDLVELIVQKTNSLHIKVPVLEQIKISITNREKILRKEEYISKCSSWTMVQESLTFDLCGATFTIHKDSYTAVKKACKVSITLVRPVSIHLPHFKRGVRMTIKNLEPVFSDNCCIFCADDETRSAVWGTVGVRTPFELVENQPVYLFE